MIVKKPEVGGSQVRITFSLPDAEPSESVCVVGDFNGWDQRATPLRKRSNGRRSAAVVVPAGSTLRFRYVTASGEWFDDDAADGHEPNPHGGHDGLVVV